jgi:hypothetical protein
MSTPPGLSTRSSTSCFVWQIWITASRLPSGQGPASADQIEAFVDPAFDLADHHPHRTPSEINNYGRIKSIWEGARDRHLVLGSLAGGASDRPYSSASRLPQGFETAEKHQPTTASMKVVTQKPTLHLEPVRPAHGVEA